MRKRPAGSLATGISTEEKVLAKCQYIINRMIACCSSPDIAYKGRGHQIVLRNYTVVEHIITWQYNTTLKFVGRCWEET